MAAPAQDLGPRRLPEIRAELAAWLTDTGPGGGPHTWASGFDEDTAARERASAARWAASLTAADLFFIAADMTRLAVSAGLALPAYRMHPQDLPAPHGLVMWEEPVTGGFHGGEITNAPIIAATWAVRGSGIHVRTWARREDWIAYMAEGDERAGIRPLTPAEVRTLRLQAPQPITAMSEATLPFGVRPGWLTSPPPEGTTLHQLQDHAQTWGRLEQAERALVVTWLLMGQTLATAQDVQPTKASAKFISRINPALLSTTRYVQLRHKAAVPEARADSDGPTGRSYRHRWMVRGHWRNAWYPSRQDHRPVWIDPHLKGPDGAPILDPGKLVSVLKR